MCYYIQTHVRCGHDEKLPMNSSQCMCTLKKPKFTDAVDATDKGVEQSTRKFHRKYGKFKGEVQLVKESWCPKCLVGQKAQRFDQVAAGSFGSVWTMTINPGEPQIPPVKSHTKESKSLEEKTQKTGDGVVSVHEDFYMVPKFGTKWEKKTRKHLRREIREGKMEMVDQIRVLRDIVKANGMTTTDLEQRIQGQTNSRREAEQGMRDTAGKKRQSDIKDAEEGVNEARIEKARKKAANYQEHLERVAQRVRTVLYRV